MLMAASWARWCTSRASPLITPSRYQPPHTRYSSAAVFKSTRLQWKRFSLTARQLSSKKPQHSNTKPRSVTHTPLSSAKTTYQSFAGTLAIRSSPTLLYEAPSPTLYIAGCYFFCATCFTFAGINFYNIYLHPPPELGSWLSVAVGGACVAMAFFGLWSLSGAYRVIRRITALPRSSKPGQQLLLLKIESANMLPRLGPRPALAPYHDITFSEFIFTPSGKASPAEVIAARSEEDREREFARTRILTLPFRQASYWMWKGFVAVRSFFWNDEFIYVQIKGKNGTFKMNRNPAWALDDGRALDRLVKHRLEGV